MFSIKPGKGRVFVELIPVSERQTSGGIWLPDKHAEQSRIGTVLGYSPDNSGKRMWWYICSAIHKILPALFKFCEPLFKPGDKVFINFFSGTGVDYPDSGYHYDTHRFLAETEILGLIE